MNKKCEGTTEESGQGCGCGDKSDSYVIPKINVDNFQRFAEEQEYNQDEELRVYTIKTVDVIDGKIHQKGSGPNFQGGLVTLSTCKHGMRSTLYKNYWIHDKKNIWIAGFATSELHGKDGFSDSILLFLGKVKQVYDTFYEAWNGINSKSRSKKNAKENPIGDLYPPESYLKEPSKKPKDYKICKDHSHYENGFKDDIKTGLVFIFDLENTFVFGPQGKVIDDKKYFEQKTGLDGYLTARNRRDSHGKKTNIGDFISGITGG